MKAKHAIVALLLVAACAVYLVFVESKQRSTTEQKEFEKKIFHFSSDDADVLQLIEGAKDILCEKEDKDKWLMRKPLSVRADNEEIDRILSRLEFLETQRRITAEGDNPLRLEDYGLSSPAIEVAFREKENTHTLLVGSQTPAKDNVYVMVKGEEVVHVTGKNILDTLKKETNEMRDKYPLRFDVPKVTKLGLRDKDKDIEVRKQDGKWRLIRPVDARVDESAVNKIVDKLKDAKVLWNDFVSDKPENLAAYGLDSPAFTAEVWEEESARKIAFGSKLEKDDTKLYARTEGSDTVYALPKSVLDEIDKGLGDLRDKKVLHIDRDKVEKVELKTGDAAVVLTKKGDEWSFEAPGTHKGKKADVNSFLWDIEDLESKEFIDSPGPLAGYGLEEPWSTVTLFGAGDAPAGQVLFGDVKDESAYVKNHDEPAVMLVDKGIRDTVSAGHLAFMEKQVVTFEKDDANKLTVQREDKTFSFAKAEDGKWTCVEPEGGEPKESAIDDILWSLSSLNAKKLVAEGPGDLKAYGLDVPAITVKVEVRSGDESKEHVICVGGKQDEEYYARKDAEALVFTLPAHAVDDFKAELLEKEETEQKADTEPKDSAP